MEHVNDIDDRLARAIGIPGFGLSIPHVTGLFGPLASSDPRAWVGTVAFVALAAAIWQGNRWLLFRQRERLDWFTRPVGKVMFLVVGCVFYTAPVTWLAIRGWYAWSGIPVDQAAIVQVVLTNVICVLVVTHVYETVFLVKARQDDRVQLERMQRTRAEAELAALRSQVDPHFLFNSLATLGWLIGRDPGAAAEFTERLASLYRYVLVNRDRDLVQLSDELANFRDAVRLYAVRFGAGLRVEERLEGLDPERLVLPPLSLQVLLENAVKHNRFSEREPLVVRLEARGAALALSNDLRPREDALGAGSGLANLAERYRLLGASIDVDPAGPFRVTLPLREVR
ncbi:MAG: histidine kinase [Myxococcales bacterium]|nr:histidine kinase [Myxococcales bacterium]